MEQALFTCLPRLCGRLSCIETKWSSSNDLKDELGNETPTVDRKGKFVKEIGVKLKEGVEAFKIKTHKPLGENDFYVKNYTDEDETNPDYKNTDVIISIILKEENKAFKVEKYEHTYPHSWRTDKPVLYYPLDAWFKNYCIERQDGGAE